MFKRRNPLTWFQWFREGIYPRAGWRRVAEYVVHRIKRVPDTPHRIALGVAIGVFVTFSPFFGLHFIYAAVLAFLIRANVLVALIATFFGNPITFPLIGILSHRLGMIMLDQTGGRVGWAELRRGLGDFFFIPWQNFKAIFTSAKVDWTDFPRAIELVILPYFIGGLLPGLICGAIGYYLSKPLVRAYQNRRKGRFAKRIKALREKATERFEKKGLPDE